MEDAKGLARHVQDRLLVRYGGVSESALRQRGSVAQRSRTALGSSAMDRGNYSIYAVVDQMIYRPKADEPQVRVSVFARIMGAPEDRNLVSFSTNAGINLEGALRRSRQRHGRDRFRRSASCRTGPAVSIRTSPWPIPAPLHRIRRVETFIEATYQYQIAPWWNLQPDFQYLFPAVQGGIVNPADPERSVDPRRGGVRRPHHHHLLIRTPGLPGPSLSKTTDRGYDHHSLRPNRRDPSCRRPSRGADRCLAPRRRFATALADAPAFAKDSDASTFSVLAAKTRPSVVLDRSRPTATLNPYGVDGREGFQSARIHRGDDPRLQLEQRARTSQGLGTTIVADRSGRRISSHTLRRPCRGICAGCPGGVGMSTSLAMLTLGLRDRREPAEQRWHGGAPSAQGCLVVFDAQRRRRARPWTSRKHRLAPWSNIVGDRPRLERHAVRHHAWARRPQGRATTVPSRANVLRISLGDRSPTAR